MDDLDMLLRQTFREREADAPEATCLTAAVRARSGERVHARRKFATAGAVGVLAAAGCFAFAAVHRGHGADTASGAATGIPHKTASVPPGMKAWSSHGLEVLVPDSWTANAEHCGAPTAPTVIIDEGATEACATLNPAPKDIVKFGTLVPDGSVQLHPTVLDGEAAETGTGKLRNGQTFTQLSVPGRKVVVTVASEDPDLVKRVIASARLVDHDTTTGCASSLAVVAPSKPAREDAAQHMVPGTPTRAVVCHYGSGYQPWQPAPSAPTYLGHGTVVPADQLERLTADLNALKPGLATWDGMAGTCPSADRDGYLFRFFYASGPPLDVYLHAGTCDREGFDNGIVTGYVSQTFLTDISGVPNVFSGGTPFDAIR